MLGILTDAHSQIYYELPTKLRTEDTNWVFFLLVQPLHHLAYSTY